MLNSALAFAEHNVPIFPVRVSFQVDRWQKRPCVTDWARRATANILQIEDWWQLWPQAIVGVPLARVGLVCLDADRHPGGADGVEALRQIALPPHSIVTTKSGGEHHFFSQSEPPIRFKRWAGGEVLGDGRFVVGYSVAPFIADAPMWPEGLLEALPQRDTHHTSRPERNTTPRPYTGEPEYVPERTASLKLRSQYLLRAVEHARKDERHNTVYWAACRFGNMIGEGKIKSEIAEKLLLSSAKFNGKWDEEDLQATIRDGLRTGKEEWDEWAARKRTGCDVNQQCV